LGIEAAAEPSAKFGPYTLFPSQRLLLRGGAPVRIGGRALDILIVLIGHRGSIVGKDELKAEVWRGLHVEDANIKVHISALRRALANGADGTRYIATSSSRGYSFVAPLLEEMSSITPPDLARPNRYMNNLPHRLTRLVGRSQAVSAVRERLRGDRLLTIVGAGGVGKTSVALAVAQADLEAFANGSLLVDFAPVQHDEFVVNAVAAALGLELKDDNPMPILVAALREREILLILDNCEHVVGGVAQLTTAILENAPLIRVLATSQEPLRIPGEALHRLSPLDCPSEEESDLDALRASPSIQLFLERVRSEATESRVTDKDIAVVAGICRRLDGIPLAIEFAAAYAGPLGFTQLALHLEQRLRLLTARRHAPLWRHQTLHAAQDWSYGLLSQVEQAVLRRISVFAGRFTLEAASFVAADPGEDAFDVIDRLADLVVKSLVAFEVNAGNARYRLLYTTQTYASEKLRQSGDAIDVRGRHAAYYANLLIAAWDNRSTLFETGGYAVFRDQIDDVRAALRWSFSDVENRTVGVKLAAGAALCFVELGLMIEAREWSRRGLEAFAVGACETRFRLMLEYSLAHALIITRGNVEETHLAVLKGLKATWPEAERDLELRSLSGFNIFQTRVGNFKAAMNAAVRAQQIAPPDDPEAVATAAGMLAQAFHYKGELSKAETQSRLCLGSIPFDRRLNTIRFGIDQRIRAFAITARLHWLLGRPDQAKEAARALVYFGSMADNPVFEIMSVDYSALLALLCGDWDLAWTNAQRIDQIARHHLIQPYTTIAAAYGAQVKFRTKTDYDIKDYDVVFEQIRSTGWSLSFFAIGYIEALTDADRTAEARGLVEGLSQCMAAEEQLVFLPEYLRLLANICLRDGDVKAARTAFHRAIEMARAQSALAWELRSSIDLAMLERAQNPRRAKDVLEPVLSRYTEGFQTRDVLAAIHLRDELALGLRT